MKWLMPPPSSEKTLGERLAWIEWILKWYGIGIAVCMLNALGVPTTAVIHGMLDLGRATATVALAFLR